jgi:NmrA-like family
VKKITVFGATGMLGKPVVRELVKAGFELTALVRNIEQAQTILPKEIRLVKGDLHSPADIEDALQNAEGIYLNLSIKQNDSIKSWISEREGLENILSIATKLGHIQRIAYISSLVQEYQGQNGYYWWGFELKQKGMQAIKQCGIPYTIFYPSSFMETLLNSQKQGRKILTAGKSKHKMFFIAGEDYGRQVAKSFEILKQENKEYVVQGLEGFTGDEAAALFVKHYSKEKLSVSKAPLVLLKIFGVFSNKMSYGAKIVEALNNYPEKFRAESTWDELGKPCITLQQFAESFNDIL